MRGRAVIAGVGHTAYGKLPGRSRDGLIVEAVANALTDAGLDKNRVDGVLVKRATMDRDILVAHRISAALGLKPRVGLAADQGGAANISLISYAAMLVDADQVDTVVVCFGDTPRSGDRSAHSRPRGNQTVTGWLGTAAGYGMIHQAYRHRYNVPEEAFAALVGTIRAFGAANPDAHLQKPLDKGAYLSEPYLVDPMRRDDCCLISDGAAALIVTGADRARALNLARAIPILGFGQGQESWDVEMRCDLTSTMAEASGRTAFDMAGISPSDIDVAQLYDCFSITPMITAEDYGLIPRGQSGDVALDGGFALDGPLPLNTSGGLLSESGMPGLHLVIEAVRQMRQEARSQVTNARFALVSNQGGIMHSHATLILGEPE